MSQYATQWLKTMDLLLLQDVSQTAGRFSKMHASQLKIAKILMYQENADDGSQREGWRDKLLMGGANMKDQPVSQKSVEQEN